MFPQCGEALVLLEGPVQVALGLVESREPEAREGVDQGALAGLGIGRDQALVFPEGGVLHALGEMDPGGEIGLERQVLALDRRRRGEVDLDRRRFPEGLERGVVRALGEQDLALELVGRQLVEFLFFAFDGSGLGQDRLELLLGLFGLPHSDVEKTQIEELVGLVQAPRPLLALGPVGHPPLEVSLVEIEAAPVVADPERVP